MSADKQNSLLSFVDTSVEVGEFWIVQELQNIFLKDDPSVYVFHL